jgi:hypothetical protein
MVFAILLPFFYVNESIADNTKNIKYQIVNNETLGSIKRTVDVVLKEKISEEDLKKVALEIKNSDSKNYEKIFIGYSLQSDKIRKNKNGWATTHFNPNLEVKVIGLNLKDEHTLIQKTKNSVNSNRKVIGLWIDDRIGYSTIFFNTEGKLFMEKLFYDGSDSTDEMIIDENKKIKSRVASGNSEYFVINKKKELESWGINGIIYTARILPNK